MKEKIISITVRYKQIILYFLFGIITTVCSLGVCYLTLKLGVLLPFFRGADGEPTELLDIIGSTTQWVSGVIVAFFTNKKWVFTEAQKGLRAGFKQFGIFAASRVGTYGLEVVINLAMIALLSLLGYKTFVIAIGSVSLSITSRFWAKAASSVLVVISNYFISKLIVFRKKQ